MEKKKVGVFHLVGKGQCVVAAAIGHKVHQAELVRPHCCSTTLIYGSNRQEGYAAIFFVAEKMIAGSHHHIVGAACKIVIIIVLLMEIEAKISLSRYLNTPLNR